MKSFGGFDHFSVVVIFLLILIVDLRISEGASDSSDIVLDESRPDIFYCPTTPHSNKDKKVLAALPMAKLCEYGGNNNRPHSTNSDCLNDADETALACDEKSRFQKRLRVRQSTENLINGISG
ncbi:hypothetical protein BV898_02492 [Hypsibius exemplaris]|uniref:Uncharacterized protein n=1 Tax=Hypsibius exemplaris TaxID=2072580 RepID=A0A1W0X8B4_HYPEX|nr:hypothetical protein BV898_02492 [Hypsibius exemplaris]